jgi:branched-chain amino acid transport system ATP-binding protein
MLTLERVSAGYGDTRVLNNVSFEVRRGEAVALLGRNGMGKTTTLRAITGLNRARSGHIFFKGQDISRLQPFAIARLGIGYAPEGRQLFAPLSVVQNLRIPFVNKQGNRSQWHPRLERIYGLFPVLRERSHQAAGSLSGGEQQMVAIARALIGGDDLIVLDEPTEGLAPTVVATIVGALEKLKAEGLTVLLVEQNTHTAFAIADRAYIIEKGQIAAEGTTTALRQDSELLQRLLGVGVGDDSLLAAPVQRSS